MPLPKPTAKPEWTEGNINFATITIEPTASKKEAGWLINEKPAREFMNWLFYNIGVDWLNYFESVTDLNFMVKYAAIVGSTPQSTHATLALANAAVNPGDSILVVSDLTINAIQQITKNNILIEFLPGVTVAKGSAVTGIQLSATGVRIERGRFVGFSGVGEEAILVDAASDNCSMLMPRFFNNTVNYQDNSTSGFTVIGDITE